MPSKNVWANILYGPAVMERPDFIIKKNSSFQISLISRLSNANKQFLAKFKILLFLPDNYRDLNIFMWHTVCPNEKTCV